MTNVWSFSSHAVTSLISIYSFSKCFFLIKRNIYTHLLWDIWKMSKRFRKENNVYSQSHHPDEAVITLQCISFQLCLCICIFRWSYTKNLIILFPVLKEQSVAPHCLEAQGLANAYNKYLLSGCLNSWVSE